MKRFFAYNGLVAAAFLFLWVLLVVVEVKIHLYWFLGCLFIGSLPLVFVAFFIASWRALLDKSKHPAGFAALTCLLLSPVFIVGGVIAVTNFKFLIGGHM